MEMFNKAFIWEIQKVNHKDLFAQFSINKNTHLDSGEYLVIKVSDLNTITRFRNNNEEWMETDSNWQFIFFRDLFDSIK